MLFKNNIESEVTEEDIFFLHHAIEIAVQTAKEGNLPIGAVVVDDGLIISEAGNKVLKPEFHPGRHAEIEALNKIPGKHLHEKSKKMTLYTNIEPCVMCVGAIVLHRIGRVVFGAIDPKRGASYLLEHLKQIYKSEQLPLLIGPVMQKECEEMFAYADKIYRAYRDSK